MANGCTFFGPKDESGESCCNKHDKAYVRGDGFFKANAELYRCQKEAGHPIQGAIMAGLLSVVGIPLYAKYRLRDKYGWFPKKEDKKAPK